MVTVSRSPVSFSESRLTEVCQNAIVETAGLEELFYPKSSVQASALVCAWWK
jgi:hypothetical protein